MAKKISNLRNEYRCCIELNQNAKYCIRIRVQFTRHEWVLPVYFLASTFDRSVRKLEQVLQFLQRNEDRLWFWGVNRSDDPMLSEEMLREAGLRLDRRGEFPRRTESVIVPPEQPVPAFVLGPMRRGLADLGGCRAFRSPQSKLKGAGGKFQAGKRTVGKVAALSIRER